MVRIALIAALTCATGCTEKGSAANDDELVKVREDVAELHKELRDLREEQRALRKDIRELRGDDGARLADGDPPATDPVAADAGPTAAKKTTPAVKTTPAKQETVKISIASNPRGAKVYIAGKVMGRTPVLLERIPGADTIDIRVEKEGYRARILTVRPEEDTKLSVQLARK